MPGASCLLFLPTLVAAGAAPPATIDAPPTWRSELAIGIQTPLTLAPSDVSTGLALRGRLELRVSDETTLGLRVASLGLGFGDDNPSRAGSRRSDILSALGWAYAEWDPGPIALSVGLGGATLSRRAKAVDAEGSLLSVLGLRLGPQDSLHVRISGGVQSFVESSQPGFAELELDLPLGDRWGLLARCLVSNAGTDQAELGFRVRTGPPGSSVFRLLFGYGRLSWQRDQPSDRVARALGFGLNNPVEISLQGALFSLGMDIDGGAYR